jgi:hypothetical protein
MNPDIAAVYIRENFNATDRLAVVLLNKRTGSFIQRLAEAEGIAASDVQAWLRGQNDQGYEVYVSMNALHLDFDEKGTSAVKALLKRGDLPMPNYLINSSPDKWQVVWKVEGFGKVEAEELQRSLARQTGADPAATDCSRVLRLPGFHNHKYATPHWIGLESHAAETYRPKQFPKLSTQEQNPPNRRPVLRVTLSQSERDWAYAKRALARGDTPERVIAAIVGYRSADKHNPRYYAELTVQKAAEALRAEFGRNGPERA